MSSIRRSVRQREPLVAQMVSRLLDKAFSDLPPSIVSFMTDCLMGVGGRALLQAEIHRIMAPALSFFEVSSTAARAAALAGDPVSAIESCKVQLTDYLESAGIERAREIVAMSDDNCRLMVYCRHDDPAADHVPFKFGGYEVEIWPPMPV